MAQANHVHFQILTNPAPPAVDAGGGDCVRHRIAVLCHQAHAELIGRLTSLKAHRIVGGRADSEDIEARGEHLQEVLGAVSTYVNTIIADTNENVGLGTIDQRYLANFLDDLISEVKGSFAQCAETVTKDLEAGAEIHGGSRS
jgi:hypothetical protein